MGQMEIAPWSAAWMWSLPIILLTVVVHAYGLGYLDKRVAARLREQGGLKEVPGLLIGLTALWATVLHAFEGSIWAGTYILLGAIADRKSAMLYSINAMTSYGHVELQLARHWQMMGSLEALNGWILFGLTTAFLFTCVQRVMPHMDHAK